MKISIRNAGGRTRWRVLVPPAVKLSSVGQVAGTTFTILLMQATEQNDLVTDPAAVHLEMTRAEACDLRERLNRILAQPERDPYAPRCSACSACSSHSHATDNCPEGLRRYRADAGT